jgi:hypothetical protein
MYRFLENDAQMTPSSPCLLTDKTLNRLSSIRTSMQKLIIKDKINILQNIHNTIPFINCRCNLHTLGTSTRHLTRL